MKVDTQFKLLTHNYLVPSESCILWNTEKQTMPYKSTAQEFSFEWSHPPELIQNSFRFHILSFGRLCEQKAKTEFQEQISSWKKHPLLLKQ